MPESPVVIIGGGISGLATAFYLGRLGIRSILVEKSNRLGGLIKTDVIEGCRLEAGPDSFIATKPAVAKLTQELESSRPTIIGSNDATRRVFIGRKGHLVPMPRGMSMMVPGDWKSALSSPLFSLATKAGFVAEQFRRPKKRSNDISVGEFVADHFGHEVLEYLADPLLTGVYGGQVSQLSARSVLPRFLEHEEKYGSLIRGVRQNRQQPSHKGSLFLSFEGGMQALTDAVTTHLSTTTQIVRGEVSSVQKNGAKWRIHIASESIQADHVVFACPSHAVSRLVENFATLLAADLHAIPYSSAILVTLVYERAALGRPLDGFGFLVPRPERRNIAAATWISTKFPSRTPSHLAAIRAFIVAREAIALMNASDPELLELTKTELQHWMGISVAPRFHTLYRWPSSMPQYVVGHRQRIQSIEERLHEHPGLFLSGNAHDGVGIPDCVRRAEAIAESISLNYHKL